MSCLIKLLLRLQVIGNVGALDPLEIDLESSCSRKLSYLMHPIKSFSVR